LRAFPVSVNEVDLRIPARLSFFEKTQRCRARAPTIHSFYRLARCSSHVSVSACRFPARRDAANDTDLCPTPARHTPARLPFLIRRVFRFCPLRESCNSRERVCKGRSGPAQVSPAVSRLSSVKPMSPLRRTDTRYRRRVAPRVASRLVSTSASSGSRGCHRQELSTRVKIITLKERIGYELRIFHTFARGFPSVRRPL